jgi:hypothetical protein
MSTIAWVFVVLVMQKMNKKKLFTILILPFSLITFYAPAFASSETLPSDFVEQVSIIYKIPSELKLSAGGSKSRETGLQLTHYPIIMIPANKRTFKDWLGKNAGNATGEIDVYNKFINKKFSPQELWLYQYTEEGKEMKNIEELTDGLKWFIYTILWYTKSNKVQILAHGEGAVLAQATIKKYNLYNLIHATVYIAGPFHGSPEYTYAKALMGSPVCSNLAQDSDFLQDINLPDETICNISEIKNNRHIGIKYMSIYNGLPYGDYFFPDNPDSPSILGADNYELNRLNHDGLRCSEESSNIFIPFLSDEAIKYDVLYDKDKDGFMSDKFGGIDCNDNDPSVFPGAPEIPGDNIDRDCNGMYLLPKMGKDCLTPVKKTE